MSSSSPLAVGRLVLAVLGAGFPLVSVDSTASAAQTLIRHSSDAVNGAYALDASGNAVHLALEAGAQAVDGALYFASTSSSSAAVARNTDVPEILDNLKKYTITGWYRAEDGPQGGRLLSLGGSDRLELFYIGNSGGLYNRLRLSTESGAFAQSGYSSSYALQDEWVFFAIAVDATATSFGQAVAFYVGTETAGIGAVGLNSTGGSVAEMDTGDLDTLAIGNVWNAAPGTPGANRSLIKTHVDDLRIIAGTLDETAIEGIRLSSAAALVRYACDEGGGSVSADDGPSAVNLTVANGMDWAEGGVGGYSGALRSPATSSSSGAVARNTASGAVLDNLSQYTITGWYRAEDGPQGGRLLSLGGAGDLLELFYVESGGGLHNRLRLHADGGNFAQSGYSSNYALEDEWVFFAVTVDATAGTFANGVKYYVGTETADASLVSLGNTGGTPAGLSSGDIGSLAIGNIWSAASGTPGANRSVVKTDLDDIRILAGALNFTAIESIRREAIHAGSSFSADAMRWTEADRIQQRADGEWLVQYLNGELANGNRAISVPPGNYRFSTPSGSPLAHIALSGYGSLTAPTVIDFQGSALWFETKETGLLMSNCKGLTIRNVFMDWDPLPFVQGRIVGFNSNNVIVIELDRGYYRLPAGTAGTGTWRGAVFEDEGRLKSGVNGFNGVFNWENREPDGTYRVWYQGFYGISLADSGIDVGDRIALFSRTGRAIRIDGVEASRFEDVTLYSSPFIAFSQTGGGAATFLRCNVVRRPGTTRLMGGNADGIRCTNLNGGPVIDSCKLEALGDDFVNVSGHLSRVIWQPSGPNTSTVVCSRLNFRSNVSVPRLVKFYERATWAPKGERMATMTASTYPINGTGSNCLADLNVQWYSGDAAQMAPGATVPSHILTLDAPITVGNDWIAVCEDFCSSGATIRNCEFTGSIARGLRLQAPGPTVEDNIVSETALFGISLSGDANYWGEGPYVHDALIEGNTITDSGMGQSKNSERAALFIRQSGDFSVWHVQRDIRVQGNTFLRTGDQAIVARGVDDLTITGNSIGDFANFPPHPYDGGNPPTGVGYPIVAEDCDGALTIGGNVIANPGPYANGSQPIVIP